MTWDRTIAFSVDVEDYFQVQSFEGIVPRSEWPGRESRVERNTERLLDLLRRSEAKATFFVLGWIAERFPGLVRAIAAEGHELASHGWEHRLVYSQTPEEFETDVRRSVEAITAAAPGPIEGYRAASFSIVARSLWALDVLETLGFRYDASIFPIRHDRYGIPGHERAPAVRGGNGRARDFVLYPMSTVSAFGRALPVSGGGYFRFLPYAAIRWGIDRIGREGLPPMIYIHPWEIDPDQPRIPCGAATRLRHYTNLAGTEGKLERLLGDFRAETVASTIRRVVKPRWS